MDQLKIMTAVIPDELMGQRLDQALVKVFPHYSRTRLQSWIRNGRVKVNGQILRPKDRIEGGESVDLNAEDEEVTQCEAQDISLDIVYEDASVLIINKPAGMVVHPAAGNWNGTLLNGLLHFDPSLSKLPRAGIIHRIDKETTGLLMVARSINAHKQLVDQLQERRIDREYMAVVQGRMTAGGRIIQPIGRHPVDRKRYAVRDNGKSAVTHYRVEERFPKHTFIRVRLETGRTHQIRVHMAHIRYPLVGDPVYGTRLQIPAGCDESLASTLRLFKRQALHAFRLGLHHPETGRYCEWKARIPDDMQGLINALRCGSSATSGSKQRTGA